ncbi:dolichyl-phosphate beta-D-mannosyltransferase [Prosthecochloris sp. GSB1]|uniref:polyprenol monophosphomannose synthase n=1 Tax=Prosthecochloris sp. GSB1 TaxID=281093 RepID=UPI000B8D0FDF|nr:polyprenol monophosphomannose synthase [Prosthecochloris sp. GSB1]ASQ89753.1 dolichyl-phosphate beta-D-mannosyltransferase [Prosthecochloris sp. GSB1]
MRQGDNNGQRRCLVVVPTYNEAENIGKLLEEIFARYTAHLDVLVIDDKSPDGTATLVRRAQEKNARLFLIERPGKMGLGTAYIEGFRFAIRNRYDLVVEMDADYSHDPAVLAAMMEMAKEADLVIGSRYMGNTVNVVNWPLGRLVLSKAASIYTRMITGMPVSDPTGGYKCFRVCSLASLDLEKVKSQGYSFQIEMNYRAWKKGLVIREIPIVFVDRTVGKSKMTRKNVVEAIWIVWWLKALSIVGRL